MKRQILLAAVPLALLVAACSSTASSTPAPATPAPATSAPAESTAPAGDIVATAKAAGSFGTLLEAATAAGLVETLQGAGPFTVFAPTDAAFAALPAGTLDKLLADPAALKQVLLYHVVSGKVTSDQVVDLTSADSVEGAPIAITVKDGKVYLNGSTQVVTPDVQASNGVIHVIDKVLLPPAAQASPAPAASTAAAGDIVATAKASGTFATLLKAAQAAGLVDTLEGAGPFTVFAPTDDAFAALPAGTLDKLLADPAALKEVLLYHVVAGAVTADQVVGLTSATSVEGAPIAITVKDGKVYLNDAAQVVATDIAATNGVIHVIDHVILPPSN
jgi:transforming growth factor-beta-induced protein